MGYFANNSAWDAYDGKYCAHCLHNPETEDDPPCAIVEAHMLLNYDECNKKDSILHMLIPRDSEAGNQQCRMFMGRATASR
jgi:hypothetical protein